MLKPPTQGAVAALHMVQCFAQAGFPKGLINAVTGKGSEIGDYMTTHPKVREGRFFFPSFFFRVFFFVEFLALFLSRNLEKKTLTFFPLFPPLNNQPTDQPIFQCNAISFTGGDTGLAIARKAAMIPIQMELGGKDVAIVCEDADLELAAANIVKGGFSYSGQRCTAVKLVLVVDAVADELISLVEPGLRKLTVGKPEDNCDITPLVTAASATFVEGLAADALAKGATPIAGGSLRREGNLVWPLAVDGVTADMRLAWEEPFGPVLPIMRVPSVEAAVAHCNASRLALQGCVFTRDVNRALAVADAMATGTVQVNSAPARGPDHFPFQGFRDSGIGSQGVLNSLEFMCKSKSVVINMPQASYSMG